MMRSPITAAVLALACVTATTARAEVLSSAPDGFSIQIDRPLAARPDVRPTAQAGADGAPYDAATLDAVTAQIWERLLTPGLWWGIAQSWNGRTSQMRLEPRVGGCWCETLRGGGEIEHGRVVAIEPHERLLLLTREGIGPRQSNMMTARLDWQFVTTAAGRMLRVTLDAEGTIPMAHAPFAAGMDAVLTDQIDRLLAMPVPPAP